MIDARYGNIGTNMGFSYGPSSLISATLVSMSVPEPARLALESYDNTTFC